MLKRALLLSVILFAHNLTFEPVFAADQERKREKLRSTAQERIYGSQLMSRQERVDFSARIRTAKSDGEREQIRKEHNKLMKERAGERGVNLTNEPPARQNKGGNYDPI